MIPGIALTLNCWSESLGRPHHLPANSLERFYFLLVYSQIIHVSSILIHSYHHNFGLNTLYSTSIHIPKVLLKPRDFCSQIIINIFTKELWAAHKDGRSINMSGFSASCRVPLSVYSRNGKRRKSWVQLLCVVIHIRH